MNDLSAVFRPANILLPDFSRVDGTRWSVVACDQYTSDPAYWQAVTDLVGSAPSTLRLMLPEIWLGESAARVPAIHAEMERVLREVLVPHPNAMIYLERTQADGRVRRGLIGTVDLEAYDYNKGSVSPIRATEGTVLERIPPRMAVRRGAALELPHVMLLVDDPGRTVIEPLSARRDDPVYDFDLMRNGGHVRGYLLSPAEQTAAVRALGLLATPAAMRERYGADDRPPLLFAVGDGNHSLASAKACYEEIKAALGPAAQNHPARYALCEVVNVHDPALDFEPIYRVAFGADPADLSAAFAAYAASLSGKAAPQTVTVLAGGTVQTVAVPAPEKQLPVGTLQAFLDAYLASHPGVTIDYIHGEDAVRDLVAADPAARVGFLFAGMEKSDLFRTVLYDGALPRKTFSMGHAHDKRFYLECRKIRESE